MKASPLLEVRHLRKRFRGPHIWSSRKDGHIVLDDVTFTVERSSITALVGSSGAGKSTLARCLCSLERPDSGDIRFAGLPVAAGREAGLAPIQMIFQDPGASLNPRFTAFEVIEEPLRIFEKAKSRNHRDLVELLMDRTGLPKAWSQRKAWQFSGGQRARLAIARALAANPRLLILDESLSGLDLSVRGQIVNLLLDLQSGNGLSYLLITHDLDLAAGLADRLLLLQSGKLLADTTRLAELQSELVGAL